MAVWGGAAHIVVERQEVAVGRFPWLFKSAEIEYLEFKST